MHDKNGNELKIGDEVILRGRITNLQANAQTCNITVTEEGGEAFCFTAKKVEKVGKSDAQAAVERGFSTQTTDSERYPK